MINIKKATVVDTNLLVSLSIEAFLPAHGHSSPKKDIDSYISKNFSKENLRDELLEQNNEYYLIYYKNKVAGFSKVIFNSPNENIDGINITKMERLYLLKEYYGLGLGLELFNFNVTLSKKNHQRGLWLEVWIENLRAIAFYTKTGLKKTGLYNFKVSETHSNPNYVMFQEY
jgi:ribosomal protein S18 acetylase RimI-like enzyme|tara:strand:+ start:236 stop:751 length:516 start_codon:yes stop_codon:yes gene_type:complete